MATQSRLPPVLLTRPEGRADRFAGELRERFGEGLRIVQSPLLAIRYLSPALPEGDQVLIFTSGSGVEAFRRMTAGGGVRGRRAWCVGDRTAEAARMAGLVAQSAGGDAAALCRAILADGGAGPFLHLHGAETRGDVAANLTAAGISATGLVVYVQEPVGLTAEGAALLSGLLPVFAPVFSPRTATILSAERERLSLPAPLLIAALSEAVAETMALRPGDRMAISERPDTGALLDAAELLIRDGA